MHYTRAAWWALGASLSTFIIGIPSSLLLPDVWDSLVTAIVTTLLFGWLFFQKEKSSWQAGLHFGVLLVIVNTCLSLVLILPSVLFDAASITRLLFFLSPRFWLGFVVVVGVSTLLGYGLRAKHLNSRR